MSKRKKKSKKLPYTNICHYFTFRDEILAVEKIETNTPGNFETVFHIEGEMINLDDPEGTPSECIILIEKSEWLNLFYEYLILKEKMYVELDKAYCGTENIWLQEYDTWCEGIGYLTQKQLIKLVEEDKELPSDVSLVRAIKCKMDFEKGFDDSPKEEGIVEDPSPEPEGTVRFHILDSEILTLDLDDNIHLRGEYEPDDDNKEEDCVIVIPKQLYYHLFNKFLEGKQSYYKRNYGYAGVSYIDVNKFEIVGSVTLLNQKALQEHDVDDPRVIQYDEVKMILVLGADIQMEHG